MSYTVPCCACEVGVSYEELLVVCALWGYQGGVPLIDSLIG